MSNYAIKDTLDKMDRIVDRGKDGPVYLSMAEEEVIKDAIQIIKWLEERMYETYA